MWTARRPKRREFWAGMSSSKMKTSATRKMFSCMKKVAAVRVSASAFCCLYVAMDEAEAGCYDLG